MKRYTYTLLVALLLVLATGCADDSVATPTLQTSRQIGTPPVLTPESTGTSVSPTGSPAPKSSPLPTLGPTQPATAQQIEVLETLGSAYAQDIGLALDRVEAGIVGTVATDAATWVERLEQALAVGYAPQQGTLHVVPFDMIASSSQVEMAGQRTPSKVLEDVLAPGNVVLLVKWHFALGALGGKPAESYAVFSRGGEPLFDTLLAMPVINAPVFDSDHF